jgi:hypothetical protein
VPFLGKGGTVVAGLMEEFRTEVEKIFGDDLVSYRGSHAADEPERQGGDVSS